MLNAVTVATVFPFASVKVIGPISGPVVTFDPHPDRLNMTAKGARTKAALIR
jgi:hypothetical protein